MQIGLRTLLPGLKVHRRGCEPGRSTGEDMGTAGAKLTAVATSPLGPVLSLALGAAFLFGASVIGSLYAGRLTESGRDLSILARGRTLEEGVSVTVDLAP
jgi:hypothetical protein